MEKLCTMAVPTMKHVPQPLEGARLATGGPEGRLLSSQVPGPAPRRLSSATQLPGTWHTERVLRQTMTETVTPDLTLLRQCAHRSLSASDTRYPRLSEALPTPPAALPPQAGLLEASMPILPALIGGRLLPMVSFCVTCVGVT